MNFPQSFKDFVATLLTSGVFWTFIGALAAGIGAFLTWRAVRLRSKEKSADSESKVTALKDEEYFVQCQVNVIREAKVAVSLCVHTLHASNFNWKAKQINAALYEAQKRGLTVRIVTASGAEQIPGAYEITEKLGIQVRLVPELQHSDLRFLKADADTLVLGLAGTEKALDEYKPSRSWGRIKSDALGNAIEREFQRLWLARFSESFQQFCADYISIQLQLVPASRLSEDIGIPIEFISRFRKPASFRDIMGPYVIVLHGKANSGKSSLIARFSSQFAMRTLDLMHFVLPYVYRYGNEEVVGEQVKTMYSEVLNHCGGRNYDVIETGSDYPEYVLPKLFSIIMEHGFRPILVYCQLEYDEALRRNERRTRSVPISILSDQEKAEQAGEFKEVCKEHGIPIIAVDTSRSLETTFDWLVTELKRLPDIPAT